MMSESIIKVISSDGSWDTISKKAFVEKYNEIYFTGQKNGTRKNSCFAEKRVEEILCKGIETIDDVVLILAWKIGKIKHSSSDNERKIKYASDWNCAETGNFEEIKLFGKNFNIVPFAEYIVEHRGELEDILKTGPDGAQCVMNTLKEQSQSLGNMMGTVYLITILYFLSRGDYPIYDRFAKIAIDAICG